MQLNPDEMKPVINRLKRAQGQLNGIIRMLEEGDDCQKIVTQLAAASKAVDRASFAVVANGLQQCLTSDKPEMTPEQLEKMFLSLA
ncbi:metal-sensitive transcriptional regulator [Rothia nasimurium]|uniref:metal-sensitive transcriptional regulator n=1 Tax=Rothia nasimurium TaxID=85336 RepID=UPI001F26042F|nr:metal-sensitive transcriptional regulator [Rothia nasimurium]